MLRTCRVEPGDQHFSLTDKAQALEGVLREEFGVTFVVHDAVTGAKVWCPDQEGVQDRDLNLEPALVAELAAAGRARVTLLANGRYLLALPLLESGQPIWVAAASMTALAQAEPSITQERSRLQKWGQRVCDHLRGPYRLSGLNQGEEDPNAQAKRAWEALLSLDRVIQDLRIHKNPSLNQQRVLEAAFHLLEVQALAWVPLDRDLPVLMQGEAGLKASDCRRLAACLARNPEAGESKPLLCNQVPDQSWGTPFPQVANLMAFPVMDRTLIGWVLAVNKQAKGGILAPADGGDDRTRGAEGLPSPAAMPPFRRRDAALLTAFVSLLELHVRSSRRHEDLKNLLVELLCSLTSAHDAKDARTYGHSERVARIAVELGREMGLGANDLGDLYLAGLLHDIGKIGVSESLAGSQELFTPEESEHGKKHVTIGYAILANLPPFRSLLPGVLYHHERYDGTGFPEGLAGDAIPRSARILAVAEAYDDISTGQPNRRALACREVEQALCQGAGTRWDQEVVEAFLRCRHKVHAIRQRGVGESLRRAIDGTLHKDGSSAVTKGELIASAAGGRPTASCAGKVSPS